MAIDEEDTMPKFYLFGVGIVFLLIAGCVDSSTPGMSLADTELGATDMTISEGMVCAPGATKCMGSIFLTCKSDGSDWDGKPCADGTKCTAKGCVATECQVGQSRCDADGNIQVCKSDGSGWDDPVACPTGKECIGGQCIAQSCTAGDHKCIGNFLATCNADGNGWKSEDCGENKVCFQGNCIECFNDTNCPDGMVCNNGNCMAPPPQITTTDLPVGSVNQAYTAKIEATGGKTPYSFAISDGSLAPGLTLNGDTIEGTPTVVGKFSLKIKLTDNGGMTDEKAFDLIVGGPQLELVSKSPLPDGEAEQAYDFQFKAAGGTKPYGWIISGTLPTGFIFGSDGHLQGTTEDPGDYTFKIRVVDDSDPIQQAKGDFTLHINVAPLKIYGKQMLDLFGFKLVVLKLITVVQNIPIPYKEQLQAKGGIKPYHWTETKVPGLLKTFLPHAGIPNGLTLADDGTLSGSVTDTSQVMSVKIPFVNINLTGFAFMAKVTDSQDPADSDQGIFFIPTVPVNLGGGGGLPF